MAAEEATKVTDSSSTTAAAAEPVSFLPAEAPEGGRDICRSLRM